MSSGKKTCMNYMRDDGGALVLENLIVAGDFNVVEMRSDFFIILWLSKLKISIQLEKKKMFT
uniref:Uncharacterized protein n=1 Tax=Lepeophtheirus salmonis TaxID=72036 RepID=A0A0K2UTA0_LEPSM